jgi:type III secretory pathway component EscS
MNNQQQYEKALWQAVILSFLLLVVAAIIGAIIGTLFHI